MEAKSPPSARGLSGGPVGSSGLGRLHMEGSEGFWALPGPWELSCQVPSPPPAHMPLRTGCSRLCGVAPTCCIIILSPTVAPVHPDSAPGDSEQNITSFNRSLHLYCLGLRFSAATQMVVVVLGAQGGGQVPGVTEHHHPMTHKEPPSAAARGYPPVGTGHQACRVAGTIPLPGGGS